MFGIKCLAALLCLGSLHLAGCSRSLLSDPSVLGADANEPVDVAKISGVVTRQREKVEFDASDSRGPTHGQPQGSPSATGAVAVANDTLYAVVNQLPYAIALNDIEYVQTKEPNGKRMTVLALSVVGMLALSGAAIAAAGSGFGGL